MKNTNRLRVTIINHCFVSAENQKNLESLAKEVDLQAIVPKHHYNQAVNRWIEGHCHIAESSIFTWISPFSLFGQTLLMPFGSALEHHNPHLINIEYPPWAPYTLETIFMAMLKAPNAKIVLTVKKNTYLAGNFLSECCKKSLRSYVQKRTAYYIAASKIARDLYINKLGVDPSRIKVCHHLGVDIDLFKPVPHENHSDFIYDRKWPLGQHNPS